MHYARLYTCTVRLCSRLTHIALNDWTNNAVYLRKRAATKFQEISNALHDFLLRDETVDERIPWVFPHTISGEFGFRSDFLLLQSDVCQSLWLGNSEIVNHSIVYCFTLSRLYFIERHIFSPSWLDEEIECVFAVLLKLLRLLELLSQF